MEWLTEHKIPLGQAGINGLRSIWLNDHAAWLFDFDLRRRWDS